ncbi:MAG: glutamine synthetase family protein [Actinomycetota bacterium]|nr:glutamine synthetase family protein [Actinomycetota bacterium]
MSGHLASLGAAAGEIDTVVVATPDIQGRLVGRRVPVAGFDYACADGVGVSTCIYGWDVTQSVDLLAAGTLPYTGMHTGMGDLFIRPDLSTLRQASWLQRSAICLADAFEPDGSPTPIGPRNLLRTQIERLRAAGFTASVGTELEYYMYEGEPRALFERDYRDLQPVTFRSSDYLISAGDELDGFLGELRRVMAAADVPIEAGQIEWGLGQIENTIVHDEPMKMADRHVLYKLAVRQLAARSGRTASFMAKPMDGVPGSSCHIHLSLRALDGRPVFWSPDEPHHIAPALRHAVAGALTHAPELMAWYAPTVNSYRRIRSQDAAGWGQTWGIDHRFTSVRVVGHSASSMRLEFRLPGADTNPYLAIAALLASVLDGIERRLDPGPPETGNPYERPAGEIPQHLGQAVARFAASDWNRSMFGGGTVEHYATIGEFEWDQALSAVTDWERRRYFDTI